jgi:glycosyltransferase involved in cell wall biosynthesis
LLNSASISISWEVVVVANGCTDNSEEIASAQSRTAQIPVHYIKEAAPGLARARNIGAMAARGNYLIYLDDDAIPTPGWLAAYVDYFQKHPGICAGGGPIDLDWKNTSKPSFWHPSFAVHFGWLMHPEGTEYFQEHSHPFGGNFFITRAAFEKYGHFNEQLGMKGRNLGLAEESEWLSRCAQDGNRLGYVQNALVLHWVNPARLRPASLRKRAWHAGVVSVAVHDRPYEHRGSLAWMRHALSSTLHGHMNLPEQLYLLYWLGTLWGQMFRFKRNRSASV